MCNKVNYINCNSCGYEDFDVSVGFSRTTAGNSDKGEDWYICPICGKETSNVEIDDD